MGVEVVGGETVREAERAGALLAQRLPRRLAEAGGPRPVRAPSGPVRRPGRAGAAHVLAAATAVLELPSGVDLDYLALTAPDLREPPRPGRGSAAGRSPARHDPADRQRRRPSRRPGGRGGWRRTGPRRLPSWVACACERAAVRRHRQQPHVDRSARRGRGRRPLAGGHGRAAHRRRVGGAAPGLLDGLVPTEHDVLRGVSVCATVPAVLHEWRDMLADVLRRRAAGDRRAGGADRRTRPHGQPS